MQSQGVHVALHNGCCGHPTGADGETLGGPEGSGASWKAAEPAWPRAQRSWGTGDEVQFIDDQQAEAG